MKEAYLGKDIVHRLACLYVPFTQNPQKPQDLHLQERIRDTSNIMFGTVPSRD